jgi:glycosyltransferase involved in cell wall biosynthesis
VSGRTRVTYFINSLEQGGAERQLAELITRLDASRYQASLVLCVDRDQLGYRLPVERIRHLNAPMFPTPLSVRRLATEIADLQTDILHTFMGWENIFGRVAARRAGVRAIISSVRCTELPRAHLLGERLTYAMADAMIVNSVGIRRELVRRARIPEERIEVIENGVDLDRFAPLDDPAVRSEREAMGVAGRRLVVVPGRISVQKNQRAILGALARLKRAGRLPGDVLVMLAGRGSPPWYGNVLRASARAMALGDQVRFLGVVEGIEKLVGAADLVLLPSRYEGLPNAVLESMASATPVIVSEAANADRLVTDGVEGWVCRSIGEEGIADALERFFEMSAADRRKMGEAGRAHAVRRFAVDRMARRTMDVYERLESR